MTELIVVGFKQDMYRASEVLITLKVYGAKTQSRRQAMIANHSTETVTTVNTNVASFATWRRCQRCSVSGVTMNDPPVAAR